MSCSIPKGSKHLTIENTFYYIMSIYKLIGSFCGLGPLDNFKKCFEKVFEKQLSRALLTVATIVFIRFVLKKNSCGTASPDFLSSQAPTIPVSQQELKTLVFAKKIP